jgi:hypothetical protein
MCKVKKVLKGLVLYFFQEYLIPKLQLWWGTAGSQPSRQKTNKQD